MMVSLDTAVDCGVERRNKVRRKGRSEEEREKGGEWEWKIVIILKEGSTCLAEK